MSFCFNSCATGELKYRDKRIVDLRGVTYVTAFVKGMTGQGSE